MKLNDYAFHEILYSIQANKFHLDTESTFSVGRIKANKLRNVIEREQGVSSFNSTTDLSMRLSIYVSVCLGYVSAQRLNSSTDLRKVGLSVYTFTPQNPVVFETDLNKSRDTRSKFVGGGLIF